MNGNVRSQTVQAIAEALRKVRQGENGGILIWELLVDALSKQEQAIFKAVSLYVDDNDGITSFEVAQIVETSQVNAGTVLNRLWQIGLLTRVEAERTRGITYAYEVNWACAPVKQP